MRRGDCETWGIQYDWGYTLDGVVLGSPSPGWLLDAYASRGKPRGRHLAEGPSGSKSKRSRSGR